MQLKVRCQGTKVIQKNRRTILIQEYENLDSKADESLTEIYDRFMTLLNDLPLVGKKYENEDSNFKLNMALPEKWGLKTTNIRDNYELDDMSLDEVYGLIKTHELQMVQKKNQNNIKAKSVALNAEEKPIKVKPEGLGYSRGKGKCVESDSESLESDDDLNSDEDSTK